MKRNTHRLCLAPAIALIGLLVMGSLSVARADRDLFPGVTQTIHFFRNLSWDRYDPPETSWVDASAGWDILPGLIEPPFDIASRGWGPPLHKKGNPGHHNWTFDYPSALNLTNAEK